MLQAARRASSLPPEARQRIVGFLYRQFNADGGCRNRAGESDLYYTFFALESLAALQADPPDVPVSGYLGEFSAGGSLDLVHLSCLVRCRATHEGDDGNEATAERVVRRLASFRAADGGYNVRSSAPHGTAYHTMLALGILEDLGRRPREAERLAASLEGLRADDGAYANGVGLGTGNTPATAAAVAVLRALDRAAPGEACRWLLARHHPEGGFLATPMAPFPDLLSTATALHTLALAGIDLEPVREPCLDFLDSLWTGEGFCGHWADDIADSEHLYYALLALGHLSDVG